MPEPEPQPGPQAPGAAQRYLCPYCGAVSDQPRRCPACAGHLDPLSRQATQNSMGPWHIRDEQRPFRPGCSYATIKKLVERAQITRRTVLRGPTTRQFWTFADRAPSVANLLGVCHNCHAEVAPDAFLCASCGASFTPETDRQYLGLAPRRPLPGEAPAERVAEIASGDTAHASDASTRRPARPAFPADPRPSAQAPPAPRRTPLVAMILMTAILGLAIGAAATLVGAASMGWIDLAAIEPDATTGPGPAEIIREPVAPPDEPAPSPGASDPPAEPPARIEPAPEPAQEEPPADPAEAEPAEARPPAPPAGPVVPPKLRRLP